MGECQHRILDGDVFSRHRCLFHGPSRVSLGPRRGRSCLRLLSNTSHVRRNRLMASLTAVGQEAVGEGEGRWLTGTSQTYTLTTTPGNPESTGKQTSPRKPWPLARLFPLKMYQQRAKTAQPSGQRPPNRNPYRSRPVKHHSAIPHCGFKVNCILLQGLRHRRRRETQRCIHLNSLPPSLATQ